MWGVGLKRVKGLEGHEEVNEVERDRNLEAAFMHQMLIKENLKAARDHQKSYANNRRKPLEFEVGYRVLLKVSPWEGVIHFVKKEIMEREVKSLKRSRISLVKVRWNSKRGSEFTWEREDHMKSKYPQLSVNRAVESASLPDFKDTLMIEADASDVGIGAVLLQKEQALGCQFIICNDHRSIKELMQQVIQTPLQQKYMRKLMGFDFGIEYKSGASNLVADALPRVHEDDDEVVSAFMALSRPVVGLLEYLKRENETLDELCQLHRRLDHGESIEGFQREQGMLLFRGKYFIGVESKLKDLLLSEFLMRFLALGGNTRDLGSFGEETDEITNLHQIHKEILFLERGDSVAGIKQRHRDPSSDGVIDLVIVSGHGRLNEDLESSTPFAYYHRGGVGDHLSLTLLRSMSLDVPKFSGSDPDRWIFSITEYFTLLNTPVDQQLRVMGFNLEGDSAEWFHWMTRNKLITSWKGFLESVQNRFGPCKYEDPQGALSKLLQTGIRELLVSKPTSLGDAFALARVMEAHLDDQGAHAIINKASPTAVSQILSKPTPRLGTPRQENPKTALLPTPPKV
ncbi:hypothetical protein Tco_0632558, partial [Tanacetum coccineum]